VAITCTYPPDLKQLKQGIPQDSLLFAGLLIANVCDLAEEKHNINTAHAMFEKITGRGFRDCFIETCGCRACAARRKRHGIAFSPEKQDRWDVVDDVNRQMQKDAAANGRVTYVDVNPALFNADGSSRLELFMNDRLHLRAAAYEEFANSPVWWRWLRRPR
jgi:hypothetical protein